MRIHESLVENKNIIQSAEKCSINVFMKCAFGNNLQALIITGDATEEELKKAWDNIYTEYVDISGMIQSIEFDLMKSIFVLDCRIKKISLLVYVQHESLNKIGMPCIGAFGYLKEYGYQLTWDPENGNIDEFKKQLLNIESAEKAYGFQIKKMQGELEQLKRNRGKDEQEERSPRKEFVRSLNNLEKSGFRIDRDKTTIEDLALMICDNNSEAERMKAQNQ